MMFSFKALVMSSSICGVSSFHTFKPNQSLPTVASANIVAGLRTPTAFSGQLSKIRGYDVSLNMEFDPASSVAIVAGAMAVYAVQQESVKNAELDTKETSATAKTREVVLAIDESEVNADIPDEIATTPELEPEPKPDPEPEVESTVPEEVDTDAGGTSNLEASGIDSTVREAMEDMIEEFEKDPKPIKTSRPVSPLVPDVDAAKKKVASTLESETQKIERLVKNTSRSLDIDVEMMEPGPQKAIPKPVAVSAPEETPKKSPVVFRVAKKVLFPWKKFSHLK